MVDFHDLGKSGRPRREVAVTVKTSLASGRDERLFRVWFLHVVVRGAMTDLA